MSIWGKPVVLKAVGEVSGGFVNIPDGDGSDFRKLSVIIPLTQSGSGTPSLDNVRPVSGWTGGAVTIKGVNLWDEQWANGYYHASTGIFVSAPTATTLACVHKIRVIGGSTLNFKIPSGLTLSLFQYSDSGFTRSYHYATATLNQDTKWIAFHIGSYGNGVYNNDVSIDYPSSYTEYYPHVGANYTYDWSNSAGAIAAGTLDVLTGVLTVDRLFWELDGTEAWGSGSGSGGTYYHFSLGTNIHRATGSEYITCSHYPTINITTTAGVGYWIFTTNGTSYLALRPDPSVYNTTAKVKAYVKDQYDNNTPIQCQALIAEAYRPTYQLTAHQVATLVGQNNLWADFGDVSAEYNKQSIYIK